MSSSKVRLAILIAYWIIGFISTHVPIQDSGEVILPNVDKIAHFVLYCGLGFFVAFWLGLGRDLNRTITLSIAICVVYAILDEGLQAFIPSRTASILDWIADVIGGICGSFAYGLLRRTSTKVEN